MSQVQCDGPAPFTQCLAGDDSGAAQEPDVLTYVSEVAQTAYLIVDGYTDLSEGSFELSLRYVAPELGETCASPILLTPGETREHETLDGFEDDVQTATCIPGSLAGPDRFYAVQVASGQGMEIVVRPGTVTDVALYAFNSTGESCTGGTVSCLALLGSDVVGPAVPARGSYQATGVFDDDRREDVTSRVYFQLADPLLGAFQGADLTSGTDHGGLTRVTAAAGLIQGSTSLTLMLRRRANDPASTDLPADPGLPFMGPADAGRAPSLVYPNDGVLVPANLGRLEFHFYPGAGNTLFELTFANAATDLVVYLRCTTQLEDGCIYEPDATFWRWLAETNRGGAPVVWSVRGTDDAGAGVGTSGTATVSFSLEDIEGAIYYWTTSGGSGIIRADFGKGAAAVATPYLAPADTEGHCVGCHALSRDGSKLVAELEGQNDGRIVLIDVASKLPLVPLGTPEKSIFESWSPDGSQYAAVYGDSGATDYDLMVCDGQSGAKLFSIPVDGSREHPTDHPDWSPLGDAIAFVRVGARGTLQRMHGGGIHVVRSVGGGWGAPTELVPEVPGKNRYYPAFSPDGSVVVFDESTCTGSPGGECDADTDPTATLFVVDAAGGTPSALTRANAPGVADGGETALTNSFPKWCPFVFERGGEAGKQGWLTFSSTRRYGLRRPPGDGTLLWMAAVNLNAGGDPSSAAFAIPFQDLTTSNHIAQWTTRVVGID